MTQGPNILVIGGAVAALVLSGVPVAVAAASPSVSAAPEHFVAPDQRRSLTDGEAAVPAEAVDVAAFEASNDEAREFVTKASKLVASEPDFAYLYVGDTWTVGFSGAVPEAVRAGLSGTDVVFDENLGYNEADLEELVELTARSVHEALPETTTVGVGIDASRKVISINVSLREAADVTAAIDAALPQTELLGFTPEVTVGVNPGGGIEFQ